MKSQTTIALICMTVVIGCSSGERPPTKRAAEREHPELLKVERFSLTEENLRLDYRVTNIFPHDIWVCTTLDSYPRREVRVDDIETRIADGTLRIRRRGNLEQNTFISETTIFATYQRLRPRQSSAGTVLLALPVRSLSPVHESHEPFSRVVLDQVVLELGCFGEEMPDLLSQSKKGAHLDGPDIALVRYMKPNKWEGLAQEQSMEVTISDVTIPGVLGGHLERLGHGIAP